MDKHKAAIQSYENILKTLNPVYAKESERDSRIDSLTQQMDAVQDTLSRLESLLRHGNN